MHPFTTLALRSPRIDFKLFSVDLLNLHKHILPTYLIHIISIYAPYYGLMAICVCAKAANILAIQLL